VRPAFNQHACLEALKILALKGKKIAFVSVYRAHPYIKRMLEEAGVPLDMIHFLDAVYLLSGEERKSSKNAHILACPFGKKFEDELLRVLQDLGDVEYVVLDNVMALVNYISDKEFKDIMLHLMETVYARGASLVMVADSTVCEEKASWLAELSDIVVDLNG
jgi:hypothetical protein